MMSEVTKFDDSNTSLSPLKRAFLALERAEARIQALEGGRAEPIAIVGMGCRIPGDEDGIDGYWRLLEAQRSAVGDGVERRFSGLLRDNQLPQAARRAALLERVDLFDPRHFGISPREAVSMDPQQRLLLEASWEALESAGIDPKARWTVMQEFTSALAPRRLRPACCRGSDHVRIGASLCCRVRP